MKALHELREMLVAEIEEITKKGELTAGSLDTVDKLTHSLKSIDTIIAMSGDEGEYSQRGGRGGNSYNDGGNMGGGYSGYYPRYVYARNQRRSVNGRYSRDDGREAMIEKLEDMMEDAPDEKTKSAIQKCISQMERD